ncbi:oxidoreductase [Actinoplanes cyaneus]|uniref:Oxidoreductase n=1 Tax=Actinoplanes cyaneus TaxID=52696 RepID=A0A919M4Z4_9ACTN|nr:NADP-dependent oxidoreductase [Actinoplanes cyaneus]MCW2139735.1 enoyl reductase [Actinoplanes cyaneus]GID69890.1 oxidoreductase [Actinoplanes cyaneus]
MSQAVVFSSFGGPDVLEIVDVAEPHAGAGDVRVRVKAAGVQPFDTMVRRGDAQGFVEVTFPQTTGNELAGVIDEVGDGVTGFAVGDEVIGFTTMDAVAEFVTISADHIIIKPAGMPWAEAGVLSVCGQTAHIALSELKVGAGDTVLVHGAAGGVGTMAVQLARAWGAQVIGTASERNHDYLRELGATPVAYGPGLVDRVRALAPEGVDAAFDAASRDAIAPSLELVKDKERVGTIGDYRGAQQFGVRMLGGTRTAARLAELAELHTEGKLRIHLQAAYPFAQAAQAHRDVESGHVRGKVVLVNE